MKKKEWNTDDADWADLRGDKKNFHTARIKKFLFVMKRNFLEKYFSCASEFHKRGFFLCFFCCERENVKRQFEFFDGLNFGLLNKNCPLK